ncbi:ABC transporter ATP-binding protein [Candidatus Saccharibacteria bacterium]|nr:ABC transporter ATP-binding protein [Candidatus Saccharibacteria bacterium]
MFKLFRFLKPYWWQVAILLTATGIQVYATLQLPAFMADIINEGIVPGDLGVVWKNGGLMLLMAVISAVASFVVSYFSAKVGSYFSRDLRAAVFQKVLTFNLADMKNYSTASLITRTTNDINQVQMIVTMMLSMLLRAPLFCVLGIVMAIRTAPEMSWIIVVGILAVVISVIIIMSIVAPKFKVFQKLIDKITMITRENLTGLKVIRAFNTEAVEQRKFKATNDVLTRLLIFVDRILELQNPLINIIFNGTTLLCSWIGISLLNQNFEYLGNMTAFAEYVTFVMMSFLMLSIFFIMIPRANVSAGRINELLRVVPKIKFVKTTRGVPEKRPSVEFRNVSFCYTEAAEKVLDDISFVAEAGKTTAFIGSTGSGKSTLINLVPRFYEATSGEVLINGVNIRDYTSEDLMGRIGLVPQRGVLFAGTVKSNIKFGAPGATDAEVIEAARIAQALDFIEKLPGGLDAKISQGGTNVSGGQKQRLSIARAICKKPDIFVFDDAFSALDMKTDARLRAALQSVTESAVVLIVAQRVSTIKDADQIIVLDKGKMVGRGTHLELLSKCKIYQSIVKSQLSDAEFEREMAEAGKMKEGFARRSEMDEEENVKQDSSGVMAKMGKFTRKEANGAAR